MGAREGEEVLKYVSSSSFRATSEQLTAHGSQSSEAFMLSYRTEWPGLVNLLDRPTAGSASLSPKVYEQRYT